jgi:HEPN domain-containing protein
VSKAEEDFAATQELLSAVPPLCDAACFHAQQCAEKYLKAFLVEQGVPFPRTHLLVDLLILCLPLDSAFEALRRDLEDLTVYGVRVRYPGFDATPSAAQEALTAAARVRAFVREKLGLS